MKQLTFDEILQQIYGLNEAETKRLESMLPNIKANARLYAEVREFWTAAGKQAAVEHYFNMEGHKSNPNTMKESLDFVEKLCDGLKPWSGITENTQTKQN